MPTLYTSLIARRNPQLRTLAPPRQRPPVAPTFAAKSLPLLQAAVADEHAARFAEIMEVPETVRSIAVIGAGLAGLSAAYELRKRGYSVAIFEASDRPGGRTVTVNGIVKRHHMDGGAELIGSNHPLWLSYADQFHLGFSDVLEYNKSPIVIGTRLLRPGAEDELLAQMNKAFSFISSHAKKSSTPMLRGPIPRRVLSTRTTCMTSLCGQIGDLYVSRPSCSSSNQTTVFLRKIKACLGCSQWSRAVGWNVIG